MKSNNERPFSVASVLVMTALCSGFYFLGMWHGIVRTENVMFNRSPTADVEVSEPAEEIGSPDAQQQLDSQGLTLLQRVELESAQKERLMRNISDNLEKPGVNQYIRERQGILVDHQFGDLIDACGLNAEETEYFLELLTSRQMLQEDMRMKLMTGLLTEEERNSLLQNISVETDALDAEIDWFLNNELDSEFFQYYEQTEGERSFVDSMKKRLEQTGVTLEEGVDEQLVAMLYDEITTFPFSVDFEDGGAPVFSEFTPEKIDTFLSEMQNLRAPIAAQAARLLSPEQAEILSGSFEDYVGFYEQRLRTVQQLFNPAP
jgi:hypothetical protein